MNTTTDSDNNYHAACRQLFEDIEALVDETDYDYDNNGNVMEIYLAAGERAVVNKQAPMQEVWLATKSGGRHFRLIDGEWRDTRDNSTLMAQLQAVLA